MTTAHHLTIHLAPVSPAVRFLERLFGAVFFTVLAPVAFAIFILAGLALALGLAGLL